MPQRTRTQAKWHADAPYFATQHERLTVPSRNEVIMRCFPTGHRFDLAECRFDHAVRGKIKTSPGHTT